MGKSSSQVFRYYSFWRDECLRENWHVWHNHIVVCNTSFTQTKYNFPQMRNISGSVCITSEEMSCLSKLQKSLVIHEGNTKQISTMTVTLYLIKIIDVRKNTSEHRILYKISS